MAPTPTSEEASRETAAEKDVLEHHQTRCASLEMGVALGKLQVQVQAQERLKEVEEEEEEEETRAWAQQVY